MIEINILPTYSKIADRDLIDKLKIDLPDELKYSLSEHQAKTYEAYKEHDTKIIFNTSMTGDGKSLAALLPTLHGKGVISMLPTNELISDQIKNFKKYPNPHNHKYKDIFGKEITRLMLTSNISERWKFLEMLMMHNEIIFTNPDLFHLMMTHQYGGYGIDFNWQAHQLPFSILNTYDYFIFDEFHIYGIPQVAAVTNIINYIESRKTNKKYIFLSATPSTTFLDLLSRSGISYEVIEGSYSSVEKDDYRQILQEVDLKINWLNQNVKTLDWLENNIEIIRSEFKQSEKFKGAIIVDSIANAKIITYKLREKLPEMKIIENTGLTNEIEKKSFRDEDFDLVVATSTVDIGVDFQINFLIFEAFSQGSFLQRLGRLGRHKGFKKYTAYALIPKVIYEKLEILENAISISREEINQKIREVFKEYNNFKPYINKWARVQSAQILASLEKSGENYKDMRDRFAQKMNMIHFPDNKSSIDSCVKMFWGMLNNKHDKLIIEQLNAFRGGSKFECAIYDSTDKAIKNYDLFFIIKNTNFEIITKEDFIEKYDRNKISEIFYDVKFYLVVYEYKDKTESIYFKYDNDIEDDCPEIINQLKIISGLTIQGVSNSSMNQINRQVSKEKLVAIISELYPKKLKEKYALPIHFPVFNLKDGCNTDFSIAFNKEALLLDSILWWKKSKKEGCFIV